MLCACSFFDKDNTPPPSPLVAFKPETTVQAFGMQYLTMESDMKISNSSLPYYQRIYTADKNGNVTASSNPKVKHSGKLKLDYQLALGLRQNDNLVVVGDSEGGVL